MSISDKVNEAFCWLKEEFDEIINDIEFEKGEINLNEICLKLNNKLRSINSINCLDDNKKEYIDIINIVSWNNLNYCLFHYVNIYSKIHERLFIEEDDFYYNFDEDNFYVRKKFSINLAFHPLIYTIDVAYFNFLFSFISESGNNNDDNSNSRSSNKLQNISNELISKKNNKKSKITYIYNDDLNFKQNFIINNHSYSMLSEKYPINFDISKYLENSEILYNFDSKKYFHQKHIKYEDIKEEGKKEEEEEEEEEEKEEKYELNNESTNIYRTNINKVDTCNIKKNNNNNSKNKDFIDLTKSYNYSLENKVYMIDKSINQKIKVYNGDITKINSQAIVLFANNNYKFSKYICENLFSSDLMKLEEEDKFEIKNKKSGEVYITNSYDNIHKYILHVMLPKYNSKFILATHNTMNLCVQEILYACYEKKIQSLSIPIVSFNLFFPINIFLITLLKSIRSLIILPQFYNTIKTILFVTNSNDIYFLLLKYVSIFFPRCDQEKFLSTNISVIGNKFGSVDVENRSIRIFKSLRSIRKAKRKKTKKKKKKKNLDKINDYNTCYENKIIIKQNLNNKKLNFDEKESSEENVSDKNISSEENNFSSSSYISSNKSLLTNENSDYSSSSEIFKEADAEFLNLKSENESYKNFFNLNQINKNEDMNLEYCLRLSYMYDKREKFKELKNTYFIYEYGFDELGRNAIVINFFNLPLVYNYNLLFFYLIFYFNNFMKNHFVLLFIFSENISSNITHVLSLFKDIFQLIQEFLKNLKIIYFFNYSLMFKFFIYVLYPFIPSNIYQNIIYINDTVELSKYFDVKKALRKY
ncbi:conserved Plasmodium protein, unknown function [Plasmodium relictum]|uniref:Macro domain-containing protein n=1 Tax=Plasmodium relictum TaxID=85471 RepID=A0A1J1H5B9_PLARL|nr:conserved Plasmodium protein, unknown function [Plasmodium relictum]CRG98619.1 conserved Plasmodium protein, unknown function [Plasmodium relictum]